MSCDCTFSPLRMGVSSENMMKTGKNDGRLLGGTRSILDLRQNDSFGTIAFPSARMDVARNSCKLLRFASFSGELRVSRRSGNADTLLHFALLILPSLVPWVLPAQHTGRLSDAELAAITARGRALAAYDQAVWHATDAVQMANPKTAQDQHCLARLENDRWIVVFGYLRADKTAFLITYEARQENKPQSFSVTHDDPPKEDTDFYLNAARALEIALAEFGHPPRPYNAAILPDAASKLYVYLYPAQQKAGVYPLGGDVRYLISVDGRKILEKRQLHKPVI